MSSSAQTARQISGAGLPEGRVIASFTRYADAQRAVDHLSDEELEVSALSIVGHDLATLEKVTGRLTYPRVALMSAGQGAFFGLFFGVILSLFGGGGPLAILLTVALGAAFWMLLGVISYAAQRGRRDFTSMSTIVATRYDVLARPDVADQAARMLQTAGLQGQAPRTAPAAAQPAQPVPGAAGPAEQPSQETTPLSRPDETPDGRPLYGVRVSPQEQAAHRGSPEGQAPAGQDDEAAAHGGGETAQDDGARHGERRHEEADGPWSGNETRR